MHTSKIISIFLVVAILLLPAQSLLAQEDIEPQAVMIDGQIVLISPADLQRIKQALALLESIFWRVKALGLDDFLTESCLLSVCVTLPDPDKPGWGELEDIIADLRILIDEVVELVELIPILGDKISTFLQPVQEVVGFIDDVLQALMVEDINSTQSIVEDIKNILPNLETKLNDLIVNMQQVSLNIDNLAVDLTISGQPVIHFTNAAGYDWLNVWIGGSENGVQSHYDWQEIKCNACEVIAYEGLLNGTYSIWFQGWDNETQTLSDWLGPVNFEIDHGTVSVDTISLQIPVLNSDSVILQWSAAPHVSWYEVWIGHADTFETALLQWYSAAELNCAFSEVCQVVIPGTSGILADGNYVWWLQGWGPGGFTTSGTDGWKQGPNFTK